ncbi:MAG TPA: hypothetical protein V6D03_06975 [Candidatus Caenarcaniphilales bacterium]
MKFFFNSLGLLTVLVLISAFNSQPGATEPNTVKDLTGCPLPRYQDVPAAFRQEPIAYIQQTKFYLPREMLWKLNMVAGIRASKHLEFDVAKLHFTRAQDLSQANPQSLILSEAGIDSVMAAKSVVKHMNLKPLQVKQALADCSDRIWREAVWQALQSVPK